MKPVDAPVDWWLKDRVLFQIWHITRLEVRDKVADELRSSWELWENIPHQLKEELDFPT